jgi:LytR cell envelope-related transcriptional attenuator
VTALAITPRLRTMPGLVLRTAARGAVLIGLAVVIGIVLLQVVDKGGSGGGVSPPVTEGNGEPTTSTTGEGGRPPDQVRVLVLNASGLANAAGTKANELRGAGYAIAGTGNATQQTGSTVACVSGFDKEADTLAKTAGAGFNITTFPDPPPAGAENADCVVTLGV